MMLRLVTSCMIVLTCRVQAKNLWSAMDDSVQSGPMDTLPSNRLTFDIGLSPPGFDYQSGWSAYPSFRAGFGKSISKDVMVSAYVDYYRYHLKFGNGNSGPSPASAERTDYAVYAAVRLGGLFLVGSGIYFTKSDSVYVTGLFITNPYPLGSGGISAVRFFWIFGAEYDFHVTREVFVPLGLYVRQSYGEAYGPVFLRAGVGISL